MTPVSNLHKATPVLIVDRIEPVVAFWQKLGLSTNKSAYHALADLTADALQLRLWP